MKKLLIGFALLASMSSFALEMSSKTRLLELSVVDGSEVLVSLCNINGEGCLSDSLSVEKLEKRVTKATKLVEDILSNKKLQKKIKLDMKSQIDEIGEAVYTIGGAGELTADSYEYVDIVIDEILPEILKQLQALDVEQVVSNGIELVKKEKDRVIKFKTEEELGKNLDHVLDTLMVELK